MKYVKHLLLGAGLVALVHPASAIEAPPDEVPVIEPPQGLNQGFNQGLVQPDARAGQPSTRKGSGDAAPQIATKSSAYLGLRGAEIPEVLAVHIGLKAGEGVLVRSLDPQGPASKAGLQVNDVITQIDGHRVGSHSELTEHVLTKKPGDEISLDVIHEGKPANRRVILGDRPDRMLSAIPENRDDLLDGAFPGMPQDQARRIRDAIRQRLGGSGGIQQFQNEMGEPNLDQAVREMKKRMERMLQGAEEMEGAEGIQKSLNFQSESTIRLLDQGGSVELKSKGNDKEVRVLDKDGTVSWSGPWNNEQDKAAAPPEIRERIDALNIDMNFKGSGLRLQFGRGAQR